MATNNVTRPTPGAFEWARHMNVLMGLLGDGEEAWQAETDSARYEVADVN